jgi:hypothetical protein
VILKLSLKLISNFTHKFIQIVLRSMCDDDDDDDDDLDDDGDGDDWPAPFTAANVLTCLRMPTKRAKPQMLKICR